MPIYEYNCNKCDKNFETLVMGGAAPQCPECGSPDLSRLMSACGFISKSSGQNGQVSTNSSASGCGSCSSTSCSSCAMG